MPKAFPYLFFSAPLVTVLLFRLSLAPFAVPGLIFVAFLPLCMALDRAGTWKTAFLTGMLYGAGHAVLTGNGLYTALVIHYEKSVPVFISFFLFAILLPQCIAYGLTTASERWVSFRFRPLWRGVCWATLMVIAAKTPGLLPWAQPALGMLSPLFLAQTADLIGAAGLSGMVLILNSFAARTLCFSSSPRHAAIAVFVSISLMAVYARIRLPLPPPFTPAVLTAECVQGNFNPADRWSGSGADRRRAQYRSLSSRAAETKGLRLVVWPETVLNQPQDLSRRHLADLAADLDDQTHLIAGAVRHDHDCRFNSVISMAPDGTVQATDKRTLLPYAEAPGTFASLGPFSRAPEHFCPGKTLPLLPVFHYQAGTAICMEVLLDHHLRIALQSGAMFFVTVANDAWFGKSGMAELHFAAARLQAIAFRRPMIRAASTGISGIIDSTGNVLVQSPLHTQSHIKAPISPSLVFSPWGRWGHIMERVLLMVYGLGGCRALYRWRTDAAPIRKRSPLL